MGWKKLNWWYESNQRSLHWKTGDKTWTKEKKLGMASTFRNSTSSSVKICFDSPRCHVCWILQGCWLALSEITIMQPHPSFYPSCSTIFPSYPDDVPLNFFMICPFYMVVSRNAGSPEWMVYSGKSNLLKWMMTSGTPILGNLHIYIYIHILYAIC